MMNKRRITDKCNELSNAGKFDELITFFRPFTDENVRLVSQSGIFSISSGFFDIDSWIVNNFPAELKSVILLRVDIPNNNRIDCLKALARMNIHYASLFPDIYGACMYANMKLEIPQI
jgi:hypothetical protein